MRRAKEPERQVVVMVDQEGSQEESRPMATNQRRRRRGSSRRGIVLNPFAVIANALKKKNDGDMALKKKMADSPMAMKKTGLADELGTFD